MNNKKKWWEFWKQDPEQLAMNPQDFSQAKKNMILLTIALATLVAPISTTIYVPALVTIQNAFNTDDTSMNATLSAFTFTIAVFPLFWSTIGEVYGRRRVYLISFLIYIVGAIACALAVNIQMFIAFRVVTAIGSSSVLSMGAGTIQDCFKSHERGRAFALYASGPLLGPALGPIIGGYLNIGLGWRSNLAFVAIYGSVIWLCILFFLPETSRPTPALPGQEPTKPKLRNPLSALIFFKYFNVILIVIYSGIAILTIQYKMDTGTIGLCYLPLAGGAMIGNQIGGRFSDYNFVKNSTAAKKNGQEVYPEMRISATIIALAAILACCGFISYGWCMEKNVHYAYSLVCIFFCKYFK
ncbi:major facilitator superfamily domain-containing protein [Cunninghamella echinulata]|nr:major facilitator superfamily domain-containing protein [Cunninghamella echinulata]